MGDMEETLVLFVEAAPSVCCCPGYKCRVKFEGKGVSPGARNFFFGKGLVEQVDNCVIAGHNPRAQPK